MARLAAESRHYVVVFALALPIVVFAGERELVRAGAPVLRLAHRIAPGPGPAPAHASA